MHNPRAVEMDWKNQDEIEKTNQELPVILVRAIKHNYSPEYRHVEVTVQYEGAGQHNGMLLNYSTRDMWRRPKSALNFEGLTASCQIGEGDGPEARSYAWNVDYRDLHYIDLQTCEHMIKTLRLVNRRINAYQAKHGHPRTFGQFVLSFAKAVRWTSAYINRTYTYDRENMHRAWDADGLIWAVDSLVTDLYQEVNPQ